MKKLPTIRVLLIEDNLSDYLLLRDALDSDRLSHFVLTHAEKLVDGLEFLETETFEIVLADLELPDSSGMETFSHLHHKAPNLPIVVFSGNDDEEQAIQAVRFGAQDYLVKSQMGFEMASRTIRYAIERQHSKLQLQRSEKYWREITEHSGEGVALISMQGKILYESPVVSQILGYSPEELIGQIALELIHPDDRENAMQDFARILENPGRPIYTETRFIHKNKSAIWVAGIYTNMLNDADLDAIVLNFRDVTKRKRAEEKLRESQENYKNLFDSNPQPLWVCDLETHAILMVNEAAIQHYGYTREEFEKMTLYHLRPPHDHPHRRARTTFTRSLAHSSQVQHMKKDGSLIDVEITSHPLEYYGRETQIMLATDVTARNRTEKELREARELFQSLFTLSPVAYSLARLSTKTLVNVNAAWEDLFGYRYAEVIGRLTEDFDFWQNKEDYQAAYRSLLEKSRLRDYEFILQTKTNTLRWISLYAEVIELSGEKYVLSEFVDITARKQAEAEIKQANIRFHQIANNITDIFWISDPHTGKYIYTSPAMEKIMGLSSDSIEQLPHGYLGMVFEEDRAILLNAQQHQESGLKTNVRYRIQRPDGEIRWISARGTPIFDEHGAVTLVAGIASDITEQLEAENHIKESDERFRQIAESIQEVFWMAETSTHRMIYISPAYETIWGRNIESVLNGDMKTYTSYIHLDDRIALQAIMQKRQDGQPTEIEYRVLHPDGSIRWVHDRSFPIFDESGNSTRTAGIAADITERKKAQNEIAKRQKLLEEVIQLGKNVASITNLDECLRGIYHSIKFDLGFDRVGIFLHDAEHDYLMGTYGTDRAGNMIDNTAYSNHTSSWTDWEKVMSNPNGLAYEQDYQATRNIHPDNEMYGVKHHISLAAWAGEKPVALIAVDNLNTEREIVPSDIESLQLFAGYAGLAIANAQLHSGMERRVQELKQADENAIYRQKRLEEVIMLGKKISAVTELQACLREIHHAIQFGLKFDRVGLFLYDRDTHIAHGVYGTNRNGEIEDTSWYSTDVSTWWVWDDALRSPTGISLIEDYQTSFNPLPDSDMYGIRQYATMAAWVGDKPVAMIAVDNLISQRLMNKADLEALQFFAGYVGLAIENARLNAGLEQRVRERTTELRSSETQLRISRDKLSAANSALEKAARMKDEFLASMSHELRTPLTGILGISEALQYNTYGPLTEKQVRALKSIEDSGRHLLELINDILDLSKIEAGMLDLNIEPTSLSDICQASLQLTKGMAQKKHQSVSFSMTPPGMTVRGDMRRLKQILVNLLSNAIKFTPDSGSLGLEVRGDEANQVVRLTIWDNGIGIAPENLEQLFQPFVQLDSNLSRQYEGTGLGLSLVQRMTELHGGSVEVESTPGKGSRFSILLPWSTQWTQPLMNAIPFDARSLRKALIVDDNEIDTGQASRYLRMLGLDVVCSKLGKNVVEIATQEKPGVILLDLKLQDVSGLDVLKALKANEQTRHIPVLICSVVEKHTQAIEEGAAGYLVKPLTMMDTRNELNRIVAAQRQGPRKELQDEHAPQQVVLLVDDNEIIIEMLSDYLMAQNFRVEAARSGMESLSLAPTLKPDIILMDIQMPVMDGFETIRRLRATEQFTTTPVIALTALAMTGDRERCLAAGANEYMSKPVNLKELIQTIHGLVKK